MQIMDRTEHKALNKSVSFKHLQKATRDGQADKTLGETDLNDVWERHTAVKFVVPGNILIQNVWPHPGSHGGLV